MYKTATVTLSYAEFQELAARADSAEQEVKRLLKDNEELIAKLNEKNNTIHNMYVKLINANSCTEAKHKQYYIVESLREYAEHLNKPLKNIAKIVDNGEIPLELTRV